jgi:hypothetical protein
MLSQLLLLAFAGGRWAFDTSHLPSCGVRQPKKESADPANDYAGAMRRYEHQFLFLRGNRHNMSLQRPDSGSGAWHLHSYGLQ